MKLDNFLCAKLTSVREALQCIENNHHGIIFVADFDGAVLGVATDGDIRRNLLDGGSLDDVIMKCVNTDFVWAQSESSREVLLKKLDQRIHVIPLLDSARRLVGVVSRNHLPLLPEGGIFARARSPVRISFGGGGSDLTHYFADNKFGAVINSTISLYSHATLRIREDKRVVISSLDLVETLQAENLCDALLMKSKLGLIQALLKVINPEFGFELFLHSDFPTGSGLGGSAVVSATILGCFNQFRRDQWDSHEIAEIAYQAERHNFDIAGGWQDQYATVFGGFNFIEFHMDQNIVSPMRIDPEILLELEESLILCDTGILHNSSDIHNDQRQMMSAERVRDLVSENVRLCFELRNSLLRGRLLYFGQLLDKAWQLKRQFSNLISSTRLDEIYSEAKNNGAIGGKLLGAGGGGFFLFYVPPFRKGELITHLKNAGLFIRPFRFEPKGLQSWKVREAKN
jgi:D-glycero-alpha-D-manno-heptose-7-phosphate kinase